MMPDGAYNVGVSCDPSAVRRAAVHVVMLQVEADLSGENGIDHVAGSGMCDSFGLASGARRVQDEHGVLAVHPLTGAVRTHLHHRLVHPYINSRVEVHFALCASVHEHVGHNRRLCHSLIDNFFQPNGLAPTLAFVGSDNDLTVAVQDAVSQGIG